jgi:hypothetical protein
MRGFMTSSDESTPELLRGLFGDARELAVAHLDGMRLELRDELANLKSATRRAGIGLAVFAVSTIVAALGIAQLLSAYTPIPSWGAHLIVAALCAGSGVLALKSAAKPKPQLDLVPEKELEATKNDAAWLARRTRDAVS